MTQHWLGAVLVPPFSTTIRLPASRRVSTRESFYFVNESCHQLYMSGSVPSQEHFNNCPSEMCRVSVKKISCLLQLVRKASRKEGNDRTQSDRKQSKSAICHLPFTCIVSCYFHFQSPLPAGMSSMLRALSQYSMPFAVSRPLPSPASASCIQHVIVICYLPFAIFCHSLPALAACRMLPAFLSWPLAALYHSLPVRAACCMLLPFSFPAICCCPLPMLATTVPFLIWGCQVSLAMS